MDDAESCKYNTEQLFEYRKRKTDEYFQMKVQWVIDIALLGYIFFNDSSFVSQRTFTKVQENNFSDYRDRKCQIEKDVKRTDRTELFFSGDDNSNLIM